MSKKLSRVCSWLFPLISLMITYGDSLRSKKSLVSCAWPGWEDGQQKVTVMCCLLVGMPLMKVKKKNKHMLQKPPVLIKS